MPLALAFFALAISIWIVIPGPILPLFVLSVAGPEVWPVLAALNAAILVFAVRSSGATRAAAIAVSAAALLCTLVPPLAYLVHGPPYVPIRALLTPWPLAESSRTPSPEAPVVLAIYGGAWERGSPQTNASLNAQIASWGFRVIALDYPHAPAARWPAQREAILRQIDATRAKRIVLLGHSSGAQLAMIAGALRPNRISGIITYESPVDLELGYKFPSQPDIINLHQIMVDLCGGPPEQRRSCYRSASPRYAVHPGMPPVLMLAAGRDHVVNLQFEGVLRDTLRRDGVDVTYVELPWADHSFETLVYGFHNRIAMWHVRQFLERIGK